MEIQIKRILCPVDFSDSSDYALRYALAFASAYDADLEVMHVVELPFMPPYAASTAPDLTLAVERIKEESQKMLDRLAERSRALGLRVASRLVMGAPFVEIINAARAGTADLIVMGTHGRTGLRHVLIGSVAEKVVRKAPCPVLTVKHPEHEFVMP
jgi:nucleotide-binding universal stress UspA family protein